MKTLDIYFVLLVSNGRYHLYFFRLLFSYFVLFSFPYHLKRVIKCTSSICIIIVVIMTHPFYPHMILISVYFIPFYFHLFPTLPSFEYVRFLFCLRYSLLGPLSFFFLSFFTYVVIAAFAVVSLAFHADGPFWLYDFAHFPPSFFPINIWYICV